MIQLKKNLFQFFSFCFFQFFFCFFKFSQFFRSKQNSCHCSQYLQFRLYCYRISGKWNRISGRIPDIKKGRISDTTLLHITFCKLPEQIFWEYLCIREEELGWVLEQREPAVHAPHERVSSEHFTNSLRTTLLNKSTYFRTIYVLNWSVLVVFICVPGWAGGRCSISKVILHLCKRFAGNLGGKNRNNT